MTQRGHFETPEEALAAVRADKLATVFRRVVPDRGVIVFITTRGGTGTFPAHDWDACVTEAAPRRR